MFRGIVGVSTQRFLHCSRARDPRSVKHNAEYTNGGQERPVAEYPGGKPVHRIHEYGGDEEAVTRSDAGYFVGSVAVTGRAANQLGAGRSRGISVTHAEQELRRASAR